MTCKHHLCSALGRCTEYSGDAVEISPIASKVVAQGQKERVKNAVLHLVVQPWARFILTTATTEASGAQPLRHVSFRGREGMREVLEQAVLEGRQAPVLLDGGDRHRQGGRLPDDVALTMAETTI